MRQTEKAYLLALAVKACVDSHWTMWRSPESVQALLDVGASVSDVGQPSGYDEVDTVAPSTCRVSIVHRFPNVATKLKLVSKAESHRHGHHDLHAFAIQ
jgi:hypothetical protein